MAGVVIVGAGQAGYQAAASLRAEGYQESITLIGDEPEIPYQRPPLSKGFLLGKQEEVKLVLRPESFYQTNQIDFLPGERITAIEPQRVIVAGRSAIPFDWLILATGARNRLLPVPGADRTEVCYLRTLAEARSLKARIGSAASVVIVGGGFIGLEVAAAARLLSCIATVVETLPRLMARAVAPVVSEFYLNQHRSRGVEVLLSSGVVELRGGRSGVTEVVLNNGRTVPADLVVAGIGVVPNQELAADAGIAVANGIAVDDHLRTSAPNVFAIGDCAEYPNPFAQARVRLESVQNAVDQAVSVARFITGRAAPYSAVPWFWSDQYEARLQMAGLATGYDRIVLRGSPEAGKFSACYFRRRQFCAMDSVNRPADHLTARKLLATGASLSEEQAADETFDLRSALS